MRVKNRRNKTALRIFAMGAVAALVSIGLLSAAGGAMPVLSNSGGGSWTNYREISVTENSGSTLNAYQVLVQLSGGNFPTSARSDGADIRFTDSNGNELSYWMESWDNAGRNAKIWVKVPSISASATATIRMYYGNPSAGSSSDGNTVFEIFDDFTGTSLNTNKWIVGVGSNIVGNGYIELTGTTTSGIQGIRLANPPNSASLFKTRARYYYVSGNDWSSPTSYYKSINDLIAGGGTSSGLFLFYRDGVYLSQGTGSASGPIGWNIVDTTYYGNRTASYWLNGNIVGTESISQYFSDIILGRFEAHPSGYSSSLRIDWFLTRKYASSEPILTLGAEQTVTAQDTTLPTISISSPFNGQSFTTSTATISGTASDNIALSKVEVKVGTGTWHLASGTDSWSKEIVLLQGSNLVYARAIDTSGNTAEASIAVFYSGLTPTPTLTPTSTPITIAPTTPLPLAVKQPLLTVTQTTLKEDPEVGEEVLITVSLQNNGDGIAKNIRLTEAIPSSISVSFIDGATSNTPNLVTWNGELAPSRGHAIMHTLKILEEKERAIPVIVRYEDEAGGKREASTTIYVTAQVLVTQNPVTTRTPESIVQEMNVNKAPGFTAILVLAGLAAAAVLVGRR